MCCHRQVRKIASNSRPGLVLDAETMSGQHKVPQLPKALLSQLGSSGSVQKSRSNQKSRQQARKDVRQQKKQARVQPRDTRPIIKGPRKPAVAHNEPEPVQAAHVTVQKPRKQEPAPPAEQMLPKPAAPKISKTVQSALDQDDAEISRLEAKLGLKGKKRSKPGEDGLDELLGDIDDAVGIQGSNSPIKSVEDKSWLQNKRRRIEHASDTRPDDSHSASGDSDDVSLNQSELDHDTVSWSSNDMLSDVDDSDRASIESDHDDEPSSAKALPKPVRENPYLPPTTITAATAKYIPPSMRQNDAEQESMQRLRRQIQGQVNRLSEANMLNILAAIEDLYRSQPRQRVTELLIDILINLLNDPSVLNDTFIILHAGFIAAIYSIIGPDFGAQLLERLVELLNAHLDTTNSDTKQAANLVALLSQLYNFHLVACPLIYDFIRRFVTDTAQDTTDLLIRVIKHAGAQLHRDDASALKEIVAEVHAATTASASDGLSVRQRYMLETLDDLKKKRVKHGAAASATVAEHVTSMKKTLGTLKSRELRASEPLRITLADLNDTAKKGKWWLVGASYLDPAKMSQATGPKHDSSRPQTNVASIDNDRDAERLLLAKQQRMNTDVRRAIFMVIMSATDYKDAHVRLLELNLKKAQRSDIPRVLIHCLGAEAQYNHYYTLVAAQLAQDRKMMGTFQASLGSLMRRLGERPDNDNDDADAVDEADVPTSRQLLHLAAFYAHLISRVDMPIAVLEKLQFAYLQPKTSTFVQVLLIKVLLQCVDQKGKVNDSAVMQVFDKLASAPHMVIGLQHFIRTEVLGSQLVLASQRKSVEVACARVDEVLTEILSQARVNG